MSDILQKILANKATEVAAAKAARPQAELERSAKAQRPARDFLAALRAKGGGNGARVIAECKQKSPSRGVMVPDYDPVRLARAYEAGGAAAISVLTDEVFFGGALAHLAAVTTAVSLPVLRKDFIIDAYQIWEARAHGADTFLLLAGPLSTKEIDEFLDLGRSLGMEPLIESHTSAELALARASKGKIFGINNRDLKTFAIDLQHARGLLAEAQQGDPERVVVCESGIKSRNDIEIMAAVGYKAFLIGESLATHPDPKAGLQDLISFR